MQHPELTYSATVGHIARAIRKLSVIATDAEMASGTYRGVRGQLPASFWQPDEKGLICATDTAFMSTSRQVETPIDYMDPAGENLLWKLQTNEPDDSGFHFGADISMLSQFAGEREVLFPPYTMLVVSQTSIDKRASGDTSALHKSAARGGKSATADNSTAYIEIDVTPSFI